MLIVKCKNRRYEIAENLQFYEFIAMLRMENIFIDVIKVNIYACKYTNSKYYNFLNDF